ncbi:MAG: flippase [Desulfuromonadaceae bacterium]|nr:flippase [Desulfuromonadaceae bacterium]
MNASWTKYLPEILREWLHGRQQVQMAIGNTGWLLFDRVLRMGVGLIVGALVARYLEPARFGELAYVISFIAFFQVIAGLESDPFIVRDIVQEREDASVILGTALWLRIIFGVFSWGAAVIAMLMFHGGDDQLVLITAIVGATLVFRAADTVDLWFQSQSQSRRTVVARVAAFLFSTGVKVALLLVKAPLVAFAGVICLESALVALGLAVAYRRHPTRGYWRAHFQNAKNQMHSCWPFIVTGLMIATFSRVDQIMLKELLGERELGIYAAALPVSQAWNMIPMTLLITLSPFVARKKVRDEKEYQNALVTIFRFFGILALVGSSATALTAPWIIEAMYGSQYQESAAILRIHVFSNLFIFQGGAQALWVANNNVRSVTLFATALSAIISVILSTVLISRFGVMGAPYSIIIAESVSVVVIPCIFRRDLLELYKRAFLSVGPKLL